jgi:hypothetical protein
MSLLAASAVFGCGTAHAETVSTDISRTSYWADVYGMPDLDQQRTPTQWDTNRNGGRMYCGPASAANILSYFYHEGYSGIDAPSTDFEPLDSDSLTLLEELEEQIKVMTADGFIADLADEMDTGAYNDTSYASMSFGRRVVLGLPLDAEDYSAGTNQSALVEGLEDRLPSGFRVERHGGRDCVGDYRYTITPRRIFEELHDGNQVILNIGNYLPPTPFAHLNRVGGHYIVVTAISRRTTVMGATIYEMSYHDSNRTGDATTSQSAFTREDTELVRSTVHISDDCSMTRWEILEGRTDFYLDSMIVIRPPAR